MTRYVVNEHFYTTQGEGAHAGRAAYFIRLQGCDQRCHFCDAAGTWHPSYLRKDVAMLTGEQIAELVVAPRGAVVVITGGEPALYDLDELCDALHAKGRTVHLETAGHQPISNKVDWVTLSPKPFAKWPLPENVKRADEFKLIIEKPDSLTHGLAAIAGRRRTAEVWLHPEWSMRHYPEVLDFITDAVKADPTLRAGWQLHKLYMADQLSPTSDKRSIPLGGDPKNGPSI